MRLQVVLAVVVVVAVAVRAKARCPMGTVIPEALAAGRGLVALAVLGPLVVEQMADQADQAGERRLRL